MKSNIYLAAVRATKKKPVHSLLLLLAIPLLTSCARLNAGRAVSAEAVHGHGLLASPPSVTQSADGLLVTGWVTRGAVYDKSLPLHVDISVWDEGKRVVLAPTSFSPNPIPHQRRSAGSAKYTREIRGSFAPTVHVRVTTHATPLSDCVRETGAAS